LSIQTGRKRRCRRWTGSARARPAPLRSFGTIPTTQCFVELLYDNPDLSRCPLGKGNGFPIGRHRHSAGDFPERQEDAPVRTPHDQHARDENQEGYAEGNHAQSLAGEGSALWSQCVPIGPSPDGMRHPGIELCAWGAGRPSAESRQCPRRLELRGFHPSTTAGGGVEGTEIAVA